MRGKRVADARPQNWSLTRFLWRAVLWTAVAGVAWWYSATYNAALTIWLTKALHRAAGFPAPYMYCDERVLFWHATMFTPAVGFTLASYWLTWPGRVVRAVGGYAAFCCLTAITIAIHESPYLPETNYRFLTTNTLADACYLPFGLVIWVLAAGPWYGRTSITLPASPDEKRVPSWPRRLWSATRGGWGTRLTILVMGVFLLIPIFAMTGTPEGMKARVAVARAMRQIPFNPRPSNILMDVPPNEQRQRDLKAAKAIELIGDAIEEDKTDGLSSAALYYLGGHLLYSLRPPNEEIARQFWTRGKAFIQKAEETHPG